ncbi:hypothetical protein J2T55_002573 [Methylohalomonas lacus]|uniref:Uncharacterized protein n=1 Tax=Methylohalomonas lacus TaxID=398773 RepID=A0AAE3HLN8_9GAMM|nr:hypothetical protein [Methylohalomonas lacus]MCS3904534.1 hypothetical protein [Methylohalomonas lacus]
MSTTGYGPGGDTAGSVIQSAGDQDINILGANTTGDLDIDGGTVADSAAIISMNAGDRAQTIGVADSITMDGGTADNAFALVNSDNTQTIDNGSGGVTDGNLVLTGGSAGSNVHATIQATSTQDIRIGTGVQVLGGSSGGNDDHAVIYGDAMQTLLVDSGGLTISGNAGNTSVAIGEYNFGAGIVADTAGAQSITVNAGGLYMNGGTASDAAAVINQAIGDSQTIDITGTTTLDGGSASDTFALIDGTGAQDIDSSDAMTLTGGTANDDDFAGIVGNAQQDILLVNGGLTLNGNGGTTDTITFGDYNFGAGIVADTAGTQNITINNGGGLDLNGGSATNAGAVIQQAVVAYQTLDIDGTTTLDGGSAAGTFALIDGTGAQDIDSTLAMTLTGGTANNDDFAAIVGNAQQDITVDSGYLTLDGADGTTNTLTFGDYNFGAGIVADTAGTQTITVSDGGVDLNGGSSTNAGAVINQAVAAQQTITTMGGIGFIYLDGGFTNGLADGTYAVIDSAGNQTISSSQAMTLTGGGTVADDDFAAIIGNAQQDIMVNSGDLTIDASQGSSTVAYGSNQLGAGIVADATGAGGTQTITIVDGSLDMDAGSEAFGAAVIEQADAAAQDLNVSDSVALNGGSADDAFAIIDSAGTQTLDDGAGNPIAGSLTLTGGSAGDRVHATVQATDTQTLLIGTGIDVLGGSSSGTDDYALIQGGAAQTISTQSGGLEISGNQGDTSGIIAGFDFGAGIVADTAGAQTITVNADGLDMNGGSVSNSGALINQAATNTQTVNITGATSLNGGTGSNSFALITGDGDQFIDVSTDLLLQGGSGADAAAILEASDTQDITVGGNAQLLADTDPGNGGSYAEIGAGSTQTIAVQGSQGLTLTGGSGANDYAYIYGSDQDIDVTGGDLLITGGTGGTSDTTSGIAGFGTTQTIDVAGNITLTGVAGNYTPGSYASSAFIEANVDTQSVMAGNNISLTGGTGSESRALIEMSRGTGDQVVTSTNGSITLDDGTGTDADAIIASANTQTVNATSGQLDMIGDDGAQSLIESAATTELNIGGGTWTGAANLTAGTSATINNTGAIEIDESVGFDGIVTTPTLIFSGGTGLVGDTDGAVGGADTRLNTDVDTIEFDAVAGKTVNISETDDVALQGTVGTLDLITDNAGDITDGTAAFNANNATLQTADGNIDLSGQTNGVQNFRGVNAQGGSFNYTGGRDTVFANRAVSAEVLAGSGIYTDNGISIDTTGFESRFTANVVEVGGTGNIDVTADSIVLAAQSASVGGTGPSGSDGRVITADGTQTYNGPVVLAKNTRISATDAGNGSDVVDFNDTLDGPGGLVIGSTPNFNGFIGDTTPLAYLVLNSTTSNFNQEDAGTDGAYTANIAGDFINNGTMILNGPEGNYTFIVDSGFVGAGPSVFEGGTMNLQNSTITVYGATQGQVSGSAIPDSQVFNAWTGGPQFTQLVDFAPGTIFFKAPPPQGEIKSEKNLRDDDEGDILIAYEDGGMNSMRQDGEETAGRLTQDVAYSSYSLIQPYAEDYYFFGMKTQAPAEGLMPSQLIERASAN